MSSSSYCLYRFKYYVRFTSFLFRKASTFFEEKYDIINFSENPLCAILSRISFVQRNEPRTGGSTYIAE